MRLSRPLAGAARQATKAFLVPAGVRAINLAAGSDVPNMRSAKRPRMFAIKCCFDCDFELYAD